MIQIGGLSYWLSGNGLEGGLRAGLRNTLLHPGFHFAFEPAGAVYVVMKVMSISGFSAQNSVVVPEIFLFTVFMIILSL